MFCFLFFLTKLELLSKCGVLCSANCIPPDSYKRFEWLAAVIWVGNNMLLNWLSTCHSFYVAFIAIIVILVKCMFSVVSFSCLSCACLPREHVSKQAFLEEDSLDQSGTKGNIIFNNDPKLLKQTCKEYPLMLSSDVCGGGGKKSISGEVIAKFRPWEKLQKKGPVFYVYNR